MKKILFGLSLLIASDVYAQTCIPKPDCADMGYTKTSCSGAYLKCPFDTSKMICLKELIIKSTQDCAVGMYYYSDGTCYTEYYTSKTLIGIVVKENALVMSPPKVMTWASNISTDVSGVANITSIDIAKTDMNGKANTLEIASAYPSDTASNNAAVYCNSYTTEGTNTGDWYLPALGELYTYLHGNYSVLLKKANAVSWSNFDDTYWSSSEESDSYAWWGTAKYEGVHFSYKDNSYSVSCFLAL